RETLPFAAGDGGPVGADSGIPALGEGLDPGQQPGAGRGGLKLLVAGAGAGQPQVVADGRIEQVRVLRASADDRPDVVGGAAGQCRGVEQGGAPAKVAEPQQRRGEGGLAGPVGADQRDSPAGRQLEADPVQGGRSVIFLVTYRGVSQGDGERPRRQGPRVG